MSYVAIKYIHIAATIITISGFLLRGYWMLIGSDSLQHRVTLNPFTQSWLLAKFAGLITYILLGTIALKRGSTLRIRAAAMVGAVSAFAYILGVALTKSPLSWIACWSG